MVENIGSAFCLLMNAAIGALASKILNFPKPLQFLFNDFCTILIEDGPKGLFTTDGSNH